MCSNLTTEQIPRTENSVSLVSRLHQGKSKIVERSLFSQVACNNTPVKAYSYHPRISSVVYKALSAFKATKCKVSLLEYKMNSYKHST